MVIKFSRKIINIFFILYFVVFFINDLRIPIIKPTWTVPASILSTLFTLCILLQLNHKKFINFSLKIINSKHNVLNLYIIFILYILTITLIKGIYGSINLLDSYAEIIFTYIIAILPIFLISSYLVVYKISPIKVLKILYVMFYIVLLLGIFDFIIYTFNIIPLQKIHSLFFNIQTMVSSSSFVKATAYNSIRVQSIYFEPGIFAEYIFVFSPLIYTLSFSKIKFFKNNNVNIFIKRSYIPLMWLNLILTQSPFGFALTLISTCIFFKDKILKYKVPIIFIGIMFIILFYCFNFSTKKHNNTFISRIEIVCKNLYNINYLIASEPSLGTRISNVLNLIEIGIEENIWFGIGHSNLKPYMIAHIQKGSKYIIITPEMYHCILYKQNPTFQNPPLSNMFVRYGFIGLVLYYAFIFKIIYLLYRNKKTCKITNNKKLYKAFIFMIFSILVLSCYDLSIINLFMYSVIGTIIAFIEYKNHYYFLIRSKQ